MNRPLPGNILYFYSYINTQGWLYIVKAKEADFLANIEPGSAL